MSIWIYDPPAPWEVQFREETGLFAKGLGIEDVFGARLYMHEHGLHQTHSLPASSFGSKSEAYQERKRQEWESSLAEIGARTVAVPEPSDYQYCSPFELPQAEDRSPRRRVPNIANGCVARHFEESMDYHYCGPDLPDVEDDREDPQWNSYCAYANQWSRDYPVRYRHAA